jgi:hypothetical protein
MPRYMVVANQTAASGELAAALTDTARSHPGVTFVLVVPATPPQHGGTWTEGEARRLAAAAGEKARNSLRRHGIELEAVRVGDQNPVNAAADEWNDRPGYEGVFLSTLPLGASKWLKVDAYNQLVKRMQIPVTHVVAHSVKA